MGTLSCEISDVIYQVKNDLSIISDKTLEVRGLLTVTIVDLAGTATFQRGQPIVISDSVTGPFYEGYIQSDQRAKYGPASTAVDHVLTCFDKKYFLDKGANTTNYQGWYAGDIVVDMVQNGQPGAEGATVAAALHRDSTQADFNTGLNNGTVGTTNDAGDGDLELAPAGSSMNFSVNLATGTLTNVTYAGGVLAPTLVSAIKLTSTLVASTGQNNVYMRIWSGSHTVATNDVLTFDVFVPSTNKEIDATLDVLFSDSTRMNVATNGNVFDQNGIPSYTVSGSTYTDISAFAQDQWYHRTFTFPSGYNGKTVVAVQVGLAGVTAGTFTAYFKNIVLDGVTLFASNATAFQTTPYVDHSNGGFTIASSKAEIVQSFDPMTSVYVSATTNIDPVKLIRSTLVEWLALNPDLLQIYASYDGNSYVVCTNNGALPLLLAGSNVASTSLYFQVLFSAGNKGTDPTIYGSLSSLSASLVSAPTPVSAKSDVIASYGTQTAWNTGTHNGTQATSSGVLTPGTYSRDWNDNLITNQTFFANNTTQSATGGKYQMAVNNSGSVGFGVSRLDAVGLLVDFTLDVDLTLNKSELFAEVGVTYRQVGWTAVEATYGYLVTIDGTRIQFGYGANTNTGSQSFNQLTTVSHTFPTNTTIHLKIVVRGPRHIIYVQNSSTAIIDWTDNTYSFPGYVGLRGFNGSGAGDINTVTFDNLVINPASTGTWTGPSTPLNALGTCGGSAIGWIEQNTANSTAQSAIIQTSIDGGSTYQSCTNGGIVPGLTAGVNLSGKSVIVQSILSTNTQYILPGIDGLYLRVLGAYPGSSGTRSTKPLGIDYMDRGNQSGFGTASDGQTWSKTGTGTDAVASNVLTISGTTGDVHEVLGSRTGADEEGTVRFKLSASGDVGGMELRYADSSHYYRFAVSTTTLSIIKQSAGATTLATTATTLSTGVLYWMRFRVTGSVTAALQGKVWADGILEPDAWNITATD